MVECVEWMARDWHPRQTTLGAAGLGSLVRIHQGPLYDYAINENGKLLDVGHEPADYSTDVLTERAVRFIKDQAGSAIAPRFSRCGRSMISWAASRTRSTPLASSTIP